MSNYILSKNLNTAILDGLSIVKYLPQLNIIRAFASLSVTVFHLGGKTVPILNYGWLGVQMFFILSGFVICWALPATYTIKDFGYFLAKRIIRIEPPYVISIILILLLSIISFRNLNQISVQNIFLHLAYLNNFFDKEYLSPVYWTLGIEFQFYILIGLTFPLINRNSKLILPFLLLSNCFLFLNVANGIISNYISYFIVGIFVFLYKAKKLNPINFFIATIINLSFIFYCFGLACFLISFLTIAIIIFINHTNNLINFFSKISFSLYLTHDIIGSKIVIVIGNLFNTKNIFTKGFSFSTGLVTTILFAYLFYFFIEKTFLLYSKKIHYHAN